MLKWETSVKAPTQKLTQFHCGHQWLRNPLIIVLTYQTQCVSSMTQKHINMLKARRKTWNLFSYLCVAIFIILWLVILLLINSSNYNLIQMNRNAPKLSSGTLRMLSVKISWTFWTDARTMKYFQHSFHWYFCQNLDIQILKVCSIEESSFFRREIREMLCKHDKWFVSSYL